MGMIPLPPGSNAAQTIRRLRAIDTEIFGTLFASAGVIGGDVTIEGDLVGGDIYSSNWDGTVPLALPDSGSALGYALEGDSGKSQFHDDMFMSGVLTVALKAGAGFGDYRVIVDPAEFAYGPGISMVMDPADNENYYAGITTTETSKTMFVEGAVELGNSISARSYIELVGSQNSDAGYAASVPNMGMRINAGLNRGVAINGTYVHSVAPGQFLADNATSSAHDEGMPAYSFWGATDTGMWLADSDKIGFTVSDSRIMEITTSLVQSGLGTTGTFSMPRAVGTAAAPAYSFRGDTDTGMYRYGTNSLGFATSGANRMFMNTSGIFANIGIYPGTTNTHPLGNTTYRWNAIWIATQADGGKINMGNNDTIEYDDSNNEFKFYMDGTLRTILGQNATRFSGAILYYTAMATFSSGGYATLRRRDSDGRILELTSHPKYKKNIRRAPQALKRAKALAKSANTKHWEDADDEDGESAAGLLSTDVAEHWPEAIRWDPEDPTVAKGIHYEMLVAPLLELVADLEQRVNDLERGR